MPPAISARVVLVRPSNALNIGAVARAMSNFGLDDLAVVDPFEPRWKEARSAIYGSKLLERTRLWELDEALADRHLVLGAASAHNRRLERTVVTLPALRSWIRRRLPRGGRIAVLLGSERNGLDNAELTRCHAILRIPTEADAPSMNLGQAAALVCYELSRAPLEKTVTEPDERLVDGAQAEGLVRTALEAMARTGVNRHLSEAQRRETFRRGLKRWNMTRADANWLRGLLRKLLESR